MYSVAHYMTLGEHNQNIVTAMIINQLRPPIIIICSLC